MILFTDEMLFHNMLFWLTEAHPDPTLIPEHEHPALHKQSYYRNDLEDFHASVKSLSVTDTDESPRICFNTKDVHFVPVATFPVADTGEIRLQKLSGILNAIRPDTEIHLLICPSLQVYLSCKLFQLSLYNL